MGPVQSGRDAFERRRWRDAFEELSTAASDGGLGGDDLYRLAVAAHLIGRDDDAHATFERAHHALVSEGDRPGAARAAFWLAMLLFQRGQTAPAGGWFARAARVIDDEPPCAEHGYLLIPEARGALARGDGTAATTVFRRIADIADRTGDGDLVALSRLGLGDASIIAGDVETGLRLYDEVMVAVQAGDVSPVPSGIIYCAVIGACHELHDIGRAQQWTAAFDGWCATQPDLVPFRGQCLVHRSEILQLRGAWQRALDAAREACERFADTPGDPAIGAAYYQQAELHRLRGELDAAEDAYRRAHECGCAPQPGLALLRLLRGEVGAAQAAIARSLEEEVEPGRRVRLLAAAVDVHLSAGDVAAARRAADEVTAIAARLGMPVLRATAAHVSGAVDLVEADARTALTALRTAWSLWRDIDAPYEAARARVLLGVACRELGDLDGAQLEFAAARKVFDELGAQPELDRLSDLSPVTTRPTPGGLTEREIEVLRLVASGRTNRAIADELVISEHTVARHLQNVFTKLGIGSRAAAVAFAFEHELV